MRLRQIATLLLAVLPTLIAGEAEDQVLLILKTNCSSCHGDRVRSSGFSVGEVARLFFAGALFPFALIVIGPVLKELCRGAVERQHDIRAGLVAGGVDRLHDEAKRRVGRRQVGGEAALVAHVGIVSGVLERRRRVWNTSTPVRSASAKLGAPTGMIMNSWKSIGLSACTPPLTMFIIGTGSSRAATPPT